MEQLKGQVASLEEVQAQLSEAEEEKVRLEEANKRLLSEKKIADQNEQESRRGLEAAHASNQVSWPPPLSSHVVGDVRY
eukprot:3574154-Rhodomonas_salina.1